jgi:hypothetical protein
VLFVLFLFWFCFGFVGFVLGIFPPVRSIVLGANKANGLPNQRLEFCHYSGGLGVINTRRMMTAHAHEQINTHGTFCGTRHIVFLLPTGLFILTKKTMALHPLIHLLYQPTNLAKIKEPTNQTNQTKPNPNQRNTPIKKKN